MIQAKELRIGNWLLFEEDGPWNAYQVTRLVRNNTVTGGPITIYHISDENIRPIAIAPEILVKCGFKLNDDNSYQLSQLGFTLWAKGNIVRVYDEWDSEIGVHIESLHQLQNLYYALTGEELNYKP
jgi:hypothetical protein